MGNLGETSFRSSGLSERQDRLQISTGSLLFLSPALHSFRDRQFMMQTRTGGLTSASGRSLVLPMLRRVDMNFHQLFFVRPRNSPDRKFLITMFCVRPGVVGVTFTYRNGNPLTGLDAMDSWILQSSLIRDGMPGMGEPYKPFFEACRGYKCAIYFGGRRIWMIALYGFRRSEFVQRFIPN